MIEQTKTSFVRVKTQENKNMSVYASKLGGFPYFPNNKNYPKINGDYAILLAQINFSDIPYIKDILPDFPRVGILQFFIPHNDDMFGMNTNPSKSNALVIYHEKIVAPDETIKNKEIMEFVTEPVCTPLLHECSLEFSQEEEYLSLIDEYNVKKHYLKNVDELTDKDYINLSWIRNQGSKLGGYAHFTQGDTRDFDTDEDWVLLFQLDSDENLMWGDLGIGNWFIKKEDLQRRDFTNVIFRWDST